MTAIDDRTVTAKKVHYCEECWKAILPGERYHRYAGTWEGRFFTNKACLHCAAARKILQDVCDGYNETYYGGLGEALSDCWADHGIETARLFVGFNAQWVYRSGRSMPIPSTEIGDPR